MKRALIAALMVLAACSGGGGSDKAATTKADKSTTTTTAATETTTTAAAKGPSTTTTVAPSGASTATTAATTPGAPAKSTVAGPKPLAKGTYRYTQTGGGSAGPQKYDSPPEGTMVVDAAAADGTQVSHRYLDPKGDPNDTKMRFGSDGMFVIETTLRQGGQEIRCTFDKPLAAPPWPVKVGDSTTGHANCGSFQVDISGKVTSTKPVTVDGTSYTAYVLSSTITMTGQVTAKGTQVDWFVPELRMSTHTESNTKGSFGNIQFSSAGTADLVSAKPS